MSSSDTSSRADDSMLSFLRELPLLLLVALVLAFLLRTFVVQVFFIPSRSMEPTLQVQDRMMVEKLTYLFRDPERGEVIVFAGEDETPAAAPSTLGTIVRGVGQFVGIVPMDARDFVKRVIGLPGDTVVIEDGVLLVNGTPVEEPYVVNVDDRSAGPYEVPDGSLFVLGDNRPNSADSRFGLGFIEIDDVVGRAAFVLWPLGHAGTLGDGGVGDLDLDPAPGGDVDRDRGASRRDGGPTADEQALGAPSWLVPDLVGG